MMSTAESIRTKKPRPGPSFTPEFKAEIADLTEAAVRDWIRRAEANAGERDRLPTDEPSINVTRSRLGRLVCQGLLDQPGHSRYPKRM